MSNRYAAGSYSHKNANAPSVYLTFRSNTGGGTGATGGGTGATGDAPSVKSYAKVY